MNKLRQKLKKRRYDDILPKSKTWPIVQLARHRKEFVKEVAETSYQFLLSYSLGRNSLKEDVEKVVFKERFRIKSNSWRHDPKDEKSFWNNIQQQLIKFQDPITEQQQEDLKRTLRTIVDRYSNEISGNFKHTWYKFARSVVTLGFARLLNAARIKGPLSLFSRQLDLDDQIHVTGEIDQIRSLAQKGTIVMVPTHFSNLDSILIGWVIQFLGLPPFIYGAGLNLFNIKMIAYFMNSLGAYKLDRRKKNHVYLEVLKIYSKMALRRGCHSLFFPGGTRSRSGAIEDKLKLGLLTTAVEAQRDNFLYGNEINYGKQGQKIFVVPVVINYHFVLEAPTLINDFLKAQGQERYYVEMDKFSTSYRIFHFLINFFTKGSSISVSIGQAMDILGNPVDHNGHSFDKSGQRIRTKDYFISNGEITEDKQREGEYVRILSKRIVESYHQYNRVFSSHLVAFVAFEMIKVQNSDMDLYSLLRLPEEDLCMPYLDFKARVEETRQHIYELSEQNKVGLAGHLKGDIDQVISHGIKNLGIYHARKVLKIVKKESVQISQMTTLYYYHNRLTGYDLEKFF